MPSVFTLSGSSTKKGKAKRAGSERHKFASFLLYTLGPDLQKSGRTSTAEDVYHCGLLIQQGRKDTKFARWLKGTLVPDLRKSGMKTTAKDLARCARYISKAS